MGEPGTSVDRGTSRPIWAGLATHARHPGPIAEALARARRLSPGAAAALGGTAGLGLGLAGLIALPGHAWLPLWGLTVAGLVGLALKAEPRLPAPLVPAQALRPAGPRPVLDGPFEMVELPGGEFIMGSPDGDDMADEDERPRHLVRVSAFRIARTQVTVGLWRELMGGEAPADPSLPAADLSWDQAIDFCNRLSRREGYRPCYRRTGVWRWRRWICDWRANGYRLPTEAEWEYACRAGTRTRYSFGDVSSDTRN